jgi:hypothetical protein
MLVCVKNNIFDVLLYKKNPHKKIKEQDKKSCQVSKKTIEKKN